MQCFASECDNPNQKPAHYTQTSITHTHTPPAKQIYVYSTKYTKQLWLGAVAPHPTPVLHSCRNVPPANISVENNHTKCNSLKKTRGRGDTIPATMTVTVAIH